MNTQQTEHQTEQAPLTFEQRQVAERIKGERSFIRKACKWAIDQGFTVSVHDDAFGGGEWVVKRSTSLKEVMVAIQTTDGDSFLFRDADGVAVGGLTAIYGNCADEVFNTWSDSLDAMLSEIGYL